MAFEERRQSQDLNTIISLINSRFDDFTAQQETIKSYIHGLNDRVSKVDHQLNNGLKTMTNQNYQDIRTLDAKFDEHILATAKNTILLQETITDNIIEKLSDQGFLTKPVPLSKQFLRFIQFLSVVATIVGTVFAYQAIH